MKRQTWRGWTAHVHLAGAAALAGLFILAPGRVPAQCVGDCDDGGTVVINELITGVNIALGTAPVSACPSFDGNGDGTVAINELVTAVNNALNGCSVAGTPTPTRTPASATPTPTGTAGTPAPTGTVPASCGNGITESGEGETCDDGNRDEGPPSAGEFCPANCHIAACARSGETLTADVVFATDPPGLLVAGLTVFLRYPDGTVDVPGTDNSEPVRAAVTSEFFSVTPNDGNYALTAVLIDPFFLGVDAGTAFTVRFDRCSGAAPPPAGAFACRVVDASDPTPMTVTDQVTCAVELR